MYHSSRKTSDPSSGPSSAPEAAALSLTAGLPVPAPGPGALPFDLAAVKAGCASASAAAGIAAEGCGGAAVPCGRTLSSRKRTGHRAAEPRFRRAASRMACVGRKRCQGLTSEAQLGQHRRVSGRVCLEELADWAALDARAVPGQSQVELCSAEEREGRTVAARSGSLGRWAQAGSHTSGFRALSGQKEPESCRRKYAVLFDVRFRPLQLVNRGTS